MEGSSDCKSQCSERNTPLTDHTTALFDVNLFQIKMSKTKHLELCSVLLTGKFWVQDTYPEEEVTMAFITMYCDAVSMV